MMPGWPSLAARGTDFASAGPARQGRRAARIPHALGCHSEIQRTNRECLRKQREANLIARPTGAAPSSRPGRQVGAGNDGARTCSGLPSRFLANKARMSLKTKEVDSRRGAFGLNVARGDGSARLFRSSWAGGAECAASGRFGSFRRLPPHSRESGNPPDMGPCLRGDDARELQVLEWAAGPRPVFSGHCEIPRCARNDMQFRVIRKTPL